MAAHPIESLEANAGKPLVVKLRGVGVPFTTEEDAIVMALRTALAFDAAITIETEQPSSSVILRIQAFEVARQPPPPGKISRMATQRNAKTGKHHLEVFVVQDNGSTPPSEKTFNVPDLRVQQLCHSTALAEAPLDFDEKNNDIVRVTVKSKPAGA